MFSVRCPSNRRIVVMPTELTRRTALGYYGPLPGLSFPLHPECGPGDPETVADHLHTDTEPECCYRNCPAPASYRQRGLGRDSRQPPSHTASFSMD